MLHELLLALTGHYGGVFKDTGNGIQVVADLPFIQPSEVKVLNDLCHLGTWYKTFQKFIQQYGSNLTPESKTSESKLHGLYIRSFCRGLDLVLGDYRSALLSLEHQILKDPHLPVSHIQYSLQQFQLQFPALSTVVEQIISHRAHGCYLLDVLYKNSVCGLPTVKDALERILHICHGVLYKQLCAWLIHGLSHDVHKEFFIQRVPAGSHIQTEASKKSQENEGELGIMGVTGRQMQAVRNITVPNADSPQDTWMFVVQADLLPSYIPMRVANKILFVGESVQMFETNQQNVKLQSGQFMTEREAEFTRGIQQLARQPTFSASAFEALVDRIRTHVAQHLWTMVVQEADLTGQLRVMKDFFLLGRGELYLAFIDQAQHLLKGSPAPSTEHDVNTAYQKAARNVLIENETLLQRFRLTIIPAMPSAPKAADKSAECGAGGISMETGWSCLGLTCTVQWPLHIFFTPSILKNCEEERMEAIRREQLGLLHFHKRYNRLFQFLLVVRHTQQDLHSTWYLQMQGKGEKTEMKTAGQGEQISTIWQLRRHMSFLVDNLQYYLQVDVIESQYGLLLDTINSTRDFEAVKVAHEHFLAALLAQSFVHMKSVSHCLQEILALCSFFCQLLPILLTVPPELTQLSTITKSFQRQSNILFRILSSVSSHNASPHLTQLLLRLDFNKYYTTSGGQLGK